ncbi:efflux RND transporter periplasmic adaptor subunit [Candidatus Microgenomates bacterium]|nr:efflux RND transporter periplasmic adaptor subunit [Candidatus Microgenomates bacterium]
MKLVAKIKNFFKNTPKKYLIAGTIILLVIGFLLFKPKKQKEQMRFASVQRTNIQSVVSASGTLSGFQIANLKFKSPGKLRYLAVSSGDIVRKGQFIASLDTTDLSVTLQQAQNTLKDKEAQLAVIYDNLKGHDSDETLVQKQTRTTAEVAKNNAYDTVRAAQNALANSSVYSPIAGIITKQDLMEAGQNVSAADLVAQVVNFNQFVFQVDVDESDISKIVLGQKAKVTLNAYQDKEFSGHISEIAAITKTSTNGATTITVKIVLDSKDLAKIADLSGAADIITQERTNVLTIPQDAVVEEKYVYVKSNKKIERKEVQLGIYSDTNVEVISGINENDEILINPSSFSNLSIQKRGNLLSIFGGRTRIAR